MYGIVAFFLRYRITQFKQQQAIRKEIAKQINYDMEIVSAPASGTRIVLKKWPDLCAVLTAIDEKVRK